MKSNLPSDIFWALVSLLQVVGLLWCKVVYKDSIPMLQALVVECVCRIEKDLPISERDIKLHLLVEAIDSIANWGGCGGLLGLLFFLPCCAFVRILTAWTSLLQVLHHDTRCFALRGSGVR